MKTWILRVMFGLLLVSAGFAIGTFLPRTVRAQTAASFPKKFGKLVGTMPGLLVFEDVNETIWIVEAGTGKIDGMLIRN